MLDRARSSYRDDPAVPAFDDTAPIIIFDGHCVLCSSGVQWMLRRDPKGRSRFAAVQDAVPKALYAHYGLDAEAFDTFMVLMDGRAHIKWEGVVAAGQTLPGAWRGLAYMARLVPNIIGDWIYDFVQRNRISWFGRHDACQRLDDAQSFRRLL